MAKSAAGARTMLMYHGNTLVIANAIQSERLGTEKTTIFTWGCRRIATVSTGHKQATLGTQRTPGAYLAERSAELRPVVLELHFRNRLVPRIANPEFVRHVPRRASLPVPSPELRARREKLADAPPVSADGCPVQRRASVAVRHVRVRAASEEHARRDLIALMRGPVQCRAALAVAFVRGHPGLAKH